MLTQSCPWQTAPLTQVYGPTDNTNYTIWEQAENIRSRPETWEESLEQCMGMCAGRRSSIHFSISSSTTLRRSWPGTRMIIVADDYSVQAPDRSASPFLSLSCPDHSTESPEV